MSVGNRCIEKTTPAHISGKPVALSVRILSVSDEVFRMPETKIVAGDQTETSKVVMVQVWKDETRPDVFQTLEKGFVAFLTNVLMLHIFTALTCSGQEFEGGFATQWINWHIFGSKGPEKIKR